MKQEFFNKKELELLKEIFSKSEEMVADHYKMSYSDWGKIRYDIKTSRDLKSHERVNGVFAQVVKYDARPWGSPFASSVYTIYRICIQDNVILDRLKRFNLPVSPFFYYILIHELIHVVRFSRYIKRFEAEGEEMEKEEIEVHRLTRGIIKRHSIDKREKVFDFFNNQLPY